MKHITLTKRTSRGAALGRLIAECLDFSYWDNEIDLAIAQET